MAAGSAASQKLDEIALALLQGDAGEDFGEGLCDARAVEQC